MVRKRTYCVDCDQLVVGDPDGRCKKYPWLISMKLTRSDKVCSYDSFKDNLYDEPKKDDLRAWKDW